MTKIFSLVMTLCLLLGIVAIAVSAATPNAATSSDLVIPSESDDKGVLVSGNYAYNDGTSSAGWGEGNGGGAGYTSWDTSKGYINFRQKLTQTSPYSHNAPYVEWNLSSGGFDTNSMYNMILRNYGYATVDFEYGTNAYKIQIGYHVNSKWRYEYLDGENKKQSMAKPNVEPMYMTFESITEEELQAAIDANYEKLKADLATYGSQFLEGVSTDPADYTWSIEQAGPTKTLALINGSHIYILLRSMKSLDYDSYASGNRKDDYVDIYTVLAPDGDWYLTNAETWAASTAKVKIDDINDFKHITIVAKTNDYSDRTKGNFTFAIYVDGEYMCKETFNHANYVGTFLDALRHDIANSVKVSDGYSIVFDNLTVNYYERDYKSGDALGVDDLFDGSNPKADVKIYDLSDVIYTKDYQGLQGAATVGGTTYTIPAQAKAAIAALKTSATITSTMDLHNLVVDPAVEALTINTTAMVTFDAASLKGRVVDVTAESVILKPATEADTYTVNWLDANGNFLTSTTATRGQIPESGLDLATAADYVDTKNGVLYDATIIGWMITVGEEKQYIRALTADEVAANKVVTATPICDVTKVDILYYIGVYDDAAKIVRPVYGQNGTYSNYSKIGEIDTEFNNAADGSTLVLLSDVKVRSTGNYTVPAGKTLSYDLNGHIMDDSSGAKATSQVVFTLGEGSTVNIYSSRPGAKIFHATPNTAGTAPSYTDYQVHAQGGFINYPVSIDGATANIGAFRGYEANLEYNGGCLAYSNGYDFTASSTTVERGHFVGGASRVLNINGGQYYFFARPPYAAITTTGPDFVVTANGAKFYSNHGSYGIFHDYGSSTGSNTSGIRFDTCSTFTLNNCEVIGLNVDGKSATLPGKTAPIAGNTGAWVKVFYEIAKDSKVYINNTKIVGQLYSNLNGNIYLGEGNVIATNSDLANSKIKIVDGVNAIIPNTTAAKNALGNLSLSFTHAPAYNNFDEWFDVNGTTYTIKASVFDINNYVTATAEKQINLVTVKDSVPSAFSGKIVPVYWYDAEGKLYATTYEAVGNNVTYASTENLPVVELNNGWFNLGYDSWYNVTTGEAESSTLIVADKENAFKPVPGLISAIKGIKAQFDISSIEFTPRIYVPQPAADSGITFQPRTADAATGFFNGSVNDSTYTSTAKVNGVSYYTYFTYLACIEITGRTRTIKFSVAEYDLNGDGTITDNEKNIVLTQDILISAPVYATQILKLYDHGSDEATLAYEMIRYSDELTKYTNKHSDASREIIDNFYAAYEATCNCNAESCKHILDLDNLELKNSDCNVNELSQYIYGATFSHVTSNTKPLPILYLLPLAENEKYTITITADIYTTGGAVVTKTFNANRRASSDKKVTIGDQEVTIMAYYMQALPIAHLTDIINIKVTHVAADGTETVLEGTYSLGTYVKEMDEITVTKSLYALSIAARNYKLVTRDEVK